MGHYASECRTKHRDEEVNLTQDKEEESALQLAVCAKKPQDIVLLNEKKVIPKLFSTGENHQDSGIWYLDNGPSNHMTGQRSFFSDLDEGFVGQVRFGDGSTVQIKGKGVILFECKNREQWLLIEVYYIPSLCNNIMSLGQMTEECAKIQIHDDFLWMYERSGRLLLKVRQCCNRLYKTNLQIGSPICLTASIE